MTDQRHYLLEPFSWKSDSGVLHGNTTIIRNYWQWHNGSDRRRDLTHPRRGPRSYYHSGRSFSSLLSSCIERFPGGTPAGGKTLGSACHFLPRAAHSFHSGARRGYQSSTTRRPIA